MENRKINVVSTVNSTVVVNDPQIRFHRTWERRGTVREIEWDTLRELSYGAGFWNMVKSGILYIDDMDAKIELGLEPPSAKQPQNIIVLTDDQRQRYLTVAPLRDLKEICGKLTQVELNNLVDYAIEKEIINYDKSKYLEELTGRNIIKTIELNKLDISD